MNVTGLLLVVKDTGNFVDFNATTFYSSSGTQLDVGDSTYYADGTTDAMGVKIFTVGSGLSLSSDVDSNDLFFAFNYLSGTSILSGTKVTYYAGVTYTVYPLTTGYLDAVTLPASGTYTVIITDNENYLNITTAAVPEPAECAGVAGLLALGAAVMLRRRRK